MSSPSRRSVVAEPTEKLESAEEFARRIWIGGGPHAKEFCAAIEARDAAVRADERRRWKDRIEAFCADASE